MYLAITPPYRQAMVHNSWHISCSLPTFEKLFHCDVGVFSKESKAGLIDQVPDAGICNYFKSATSLQCLCAEKSTDIAGNKVTHGDILRKTVKKCVYVRRAGTHSRY